MKAFVGAALLACLSISASGEAPVNDALAVRILDRIARAHLHRRMIAHTVHIPEYAPAVPELGNERDVHPEVGAQRAQRARQQLVDRHGLRGLVLDQKIQHQYFVRRRTKKQPEIQAAFFSASVSQ